MDKSYPRSYPRSYPGRIHPTGTAPQAHFIKGLLWWYSVIVKYLVMLVAVALMYARLAILDSQKCPLKLIINALQ